jgi:hypothetical protein
VFHRSPATHAAASIQRTASRTPGREVFRLAPPVVLWWIWLAFAVANVADFAIQGAPARFAITVSAILVTVTGLAYALALRPRVVADQADLTIVNPFRDHHVPWTAIQEVAADQWVRVYYGPGAHTAAVSGGADRKAIACWALYVSARIRRKAARPVRRPAGNGLVPPALWPRVPGQASAYADPRLPEEAKSLASLPVVKAIAVRLDKRATRERAGAGVDGSAEPVTARWAWLPLAAVVLPALALLIVVLAL